MAQLHKGALVAQNQRQQMLAFLICQNRDNGHAVVGFRGVLSACLQHACWFWLASAEAVNASEIYHLLVANHLLRRFFRAQGCAHNG